MRRTQGSRLFALLICALIASHTCAFSANLSFSQVPDMLRPGKYFTFDVEVPYTGNASLLLLDQEEHPLYTIYAGYPVFTGPNKLGWDGRLADHKIIEEGEYILRLEMDDNSYIDSQLAIGDPYPMLSFISQSDFILEEEPLGIDFNASESGMLTMQVKNIETGKVYDLGTAKVTKGKNTISWDGNASGVRVSDGECALMLTLHNEDDLESMTEYLYVTVGAIPTQEEHGFLIQDAETPMTIDSTSAPHLLSHPYSTTQDSTFWSMTPGELDDEAIWDVLTQPITVYDDGKIDASEHVYLMENPDGTGKQVAQIHGTSQGLHVIGEANEHGYVLVEAFSNYDPSFQPKTDEERVHAFDVKRGYIQASGLKTIDVQQDIAFVIDKLTQRMYMFIDGVRTTEFLIATGLISDNKCYNETIPGEYITVSHTGDFPSGNMVCRMAIRINGGILLHEVPHKVNADGTRNYSSFEGYLGTKQSHGCIRIQRLKTPEGYNHQWLWENLKKATPYKVIIWDDLQRVDSPSTWQPNPKS